MGDGEEGSSEPPEPPLDPPLIVLSVYVPYTKFILLQKRNAVALEYGWKGC